MTKQTSKVIFRVDGSKEIGMGHLVPMITLADEFRGKGQDVSFVSYADQRAISKLKKSGIPYTLISSPTNFEAIKRAIKETSPNLIILNTWHNESREHFAALKSTGARLVGFYQLGRGLLECDAVINPQPSAFIKGGNKIRAKYFFGPKYILFPREAQKLVSGPKTINPEINEVVVAIGGTDLLGLTEEIVKLVQNTVPNVRINPIKGNLSHMKFLQAIQKADLAITGGGTTVFEAAFVGTPTITIAQAPWEERTTRFAQQQQISIYCGLKKDALNKISRAIGTLTLSKRRQMSRNGQRLVDGRGLTRVMAIVSELL